MSQLTLNGMIVKQQSTDETLAGDGYQMGTQSMREMNPFRKGILIRRLQQCRRIECATDMQGG